MKFVITGPKCSGKSTVGPVLAEALNLPFVETDDLMTELYERQTGSKLTPRQIIQEIGEDDFRKLEQKAVGELADREWVVISTGGSTMLNNLNRRALRTKAFLILLRSSTVELLKRLECLNIPAFLTNSTAKDMYCERARLVIDVMEPYADIIVDTADSTPEATADNILTQLINEFHLRFDNPNSFGRIVKLSTFGESHGKAIGAILDGVKPGIPISIEGIQKEMTRRRPGQSAVSTPRNEKDQVQILSGIFEGKTTGTSIGMIIYNQDQNSSHYDNLKDLFRPGTADFTYWRKYGIRDHRGSARASGRETAARVMGGAVAKQILATYGIQLYAYSHAIGGVVADKCDYSVIESNIVRCADPEAAAKMEARVLEAKEANDSVGGIVGVDVIGAPPGLGDPVFGKLDARISAGVMSIGAVKGIEIGAGFKVAEMPASLNNDPMKDGKFVSNHSGGILGGISNGDMIHFKVAVKAPGSIFQSQNSCDKWNKNVEVLIKGRHDPVIVPRIIPVIEAMTALALLDALQMQLEINPNFMEQTPSTNGTSLTENGGDPVKIVADNKMA